VIALIDADIVSYRCAASAEGDPVEVALLRVENQMNEILGACGTINFGSDGEHQAFLSGESNFRYDIYPEYKANRKQEKPKWLQECREFLVTEWGAKIKEGYEADDAIGIAAMADTIIASDDKDLLQIAGKHYNIRTQKMLTISPDEAKWMFYFQLLVGDAADNIKGCKGIGKVKANRALEVGMSEWDLFEVCRNLYNNDEELLMNGQLLHIWRKENDLWQFPEQGVVDLENEFSQRQGQETTAMGAG